MSEHKENDQKKNSEEKKLEFTTRLTREDAAGIIEALVEGLKEGLLTVHKSGDSVTMEVPRVIDMEIEATYKPHKAKFELELSWRPNREENPDTVEEEQKEEKEEK